MPADEKPAPRIARVEVQGLFGLFDHVIDLKLAEHVTVLHGPNGVGKTTLLRMLAEALTGYVDTLADTPFARFRITCEDTSFLDVTANIVVEPANQDTDTPERAYKTLTFNTLLDGAEKSQSASFERVRRPVRLASSDERASDLQRRYSSLFREVRWTSGGHSIYSFLRQRFRRPDVRTITALRLFPPMDGEGRSVENPAQLVAHPGVWAVASDLQQRIQKATRRRDKLAEALDQSFPTRLLRTPEYQRSVEELRQLLQALEARRAALQHLGILDETNVSPLAPDTLARITPAQSGVMALYAADNEEKLAVFHGLAEKTELFLRIINSRFLRKTVRADREQGLLVQDPNGQPIELRALSSGEQHQIVMFYDLLFRTPPGTLVLIDEPELSQHVSWQRRFLPDLLEIASITGIDALVATHSPSIVGGHQELLVALSPEPDDAAVP